MAYVLIVKDDADIATSLQPELEHDGFTVLCAVNGRAAFELS